MEITVEKVMDRQKVADSIHAVLDSGVDLIKKDKLEQSDYGKIKTMRTLGAWVNAAVSMIQQETAMVRASLVGERLKQLGYGNNPQIEDK